MKRRNFNLIKTGRKNKLALAVGLALAMSAMGSVYASGNDDTFKNFANGEKLLQTAANWRTYREFLNSTGLQAIGADKAYALGYSGAGVTLGIVDTGVRTDHDEFLGKVENVNLSQEEEANWEWGKGNLYHGSHVAGIMVAKRDKEARTNNMMGVAYGANLKSIGGTNGNGEKNYVYQFVSLPKEKISNVKIINNSWDIDSSIKNSKDIFINTYINDLEKNDRLYIFSAGNFSKLEPSKTVLALNERDEINKNLINGVSLDLENNKISYFSDIAKGAEKITVVAPGGGTGKDNDTDENEKKKHDINSVDGRTNDKYTSMEGTSMAAPYVSGAAGLIQEAFPYLNCKQIVDAILSTADNNFELPENIVLLPNKKENASKIVNIIVFTDDALKKFNDADERYEVIKEAYKNTGNYKENVAGDFAAGFDAWFKKFNVSVVKLTREEVYGQGYLNVGNAVQGIGAIDVERLDSKSLVNDAYSGSKDYMYIVNTGEQEKNFQQRGYSIWSNDIAEKNAKGVKAGIAKSGDVDLILLGNNTYTGHTLVTGGKLQIVRGVNGNVIADGEAGEAIAEINGYAKNIYAYNGGKIFITDRIARKDIGENGADFYNAALPENTVVNINGCITAKDWVKQNGNRLDDKVEGGSIVDINLNNVGSTISGALYKGKNSILNVSLASGTKLNVIDSLDSIFQEKTGNNVLSSLNFNSGIVDFTNDTRYVNFKINKLSGNDGLFLLKTDLQSKKADYVIVDTADGEQEHNVGIIDKNGIIENNGSYVKISETPNNVSLKEFVLPVDTGVYQYKPLIDSLPDSSERKGWYFYGFGDGKLARPEINGLADGEEHYTTDTILNNGLKSFNSTINVSQGTSNAMKINMTKDDNDRVTGVYGSVDFTGNGAIDISVSDDGSYYKHLIGLGVDKDYTDKNDTYKFSSEADVSININNKKSSYSYGIVNEKNDGIVDINGNTEIVINDIDNRSYGLRNSGQLDIGKDLSITMNASKVFTENDKYNGSYSVYTGIESNNKMRIGGDTNIKLSRGVGVPQIIQIKKGDAAFDGNVNIKVDGEQTKYSGGVIGGFLGLNVGGYYRDDIDYAATKIKGDLNLELNNFVIGSVDSPKAIYISEKGQLDVSGDIRVVVSPADVDNKSHNGYIYNFETTKAANISTENCDLQNGGVLVVTENIMVDELDNINANGDSQLYADKIIANSITNSGYIKANEIVAKSYGSSGSGEIGSLKVTGGTSGISGKFNIGSLELVGDNSYSYLTFGQGCIINGEENGTVKIAKDIRINDAVIKISNDKSFIKGRVLDYNQSTNAEKSLLSISNGAEWYVTQKPGSYYTPSGGFDVEYGGKTELKDGGIITVERYTNEMVSRLKLSELQGNNGVIQIGILQNPNKLEDIRAGEVYITKNLTQNAHHSVNLIATQPDFLLTNDTKINPFTIIEDSSEKNGGYKLNFTINPFDAGAYNYTPTLTNEKSKDNVDLWKVTDIKLTGSTPNPTPDPDPNPNPEPNPDPDPTPNPNPDPDPTPDPNPDPNPNPNPNPTPDPDPDPNPNPTPDPNPNPNPTPNPNPDPNPDPTPDPDPNPNPTPDPKPDPDPTPDPNPTPAPVLSNLTYNTRANAINNYYRWRDEYNNLQKRLGDLRMSKEENGLWARTFHGKEESGKYGLNNQYNAFQIGYDKQLLQDDGGKWFIGAAVTSYDGKTNYAKQGKADNNSIGLALYGSYLGEKGHYFDVVARHSRLKSELTSYAAGTGNKITGDYHNWGSSLSMEYGRRISMKHDFYLQPEAELTYGTTSSASYSLSDGSRVKQDGISSLTARAGLTVGKEYKNSNIFASISAVHDFGDDNVFSITDKYGQSYKDSSNLKDSWYELSVGGNVKFNNNTYIYADLEKTFGGDIQTKWRYNFGVRYSF